MMILNCQMQFCEWFQHIVNEDDEFLMKLVWSDEAQFKLNGTVRELREEVSTFKVP
jgi:hypothetical protein